MTQSPDPNDPQNQPGEQPQPENPPEEPQQPTDGSFGAPHATSDPYAESTGAPAPQGDPYAESTGAGVPGPDPNATQGPPQGGYQQQGAYQQDGFQQQGSYQQDGYQQQGAYQQAGQQQQGYQQQGYQQQNAGPQSGPAGEWSNVPPPHIKGIFPGALNGRPVSDSDAKLWAIFAQLSVIAGALIGVGFLGWLGPLIIFLVYKDRNRFIRYNAAEALNAAIAVVVAQIVLAILFTIITVVTLGIGSFLFALVGVPTIVHIIFAIIGAVKANDRTWWNYPINIRLVK